MAVITETKYRTKDLHKSRCSNCNKEVKVDKLEIVHATRKTKHAKPLAFIILLILGILPGVLYLIYHCINKEEISEVTREQYVCHCCGLPDYLGEFSPWNVEDKTIVPMTEEEIKKNTKTIDIKGNKETKDNKEEKESK